jgi:hypothetical protein
MVPSGFTGEGHYSSSSSMIEDGYDISGNATPDKHWSRFIFAATYWAVTNEARVNRVQDNGIAISGRRKRCTLPMG